MAKKIGQSKESKKSKKAKKAKSAFVLANAVDVDGKSAEADGKLIALPATVMEGDVVKVQGFDVSKHKPLTKKQFAASDTFLDFRAMCLDQRIVRMTKQATKLRANASRLRQFGSESQRKKAKKLELLRKKAKELEGEFAADGIDIAAFLESLEAQPTE